MDEASDDAPPKKKEIQKKGKNKHKSAVAFEGLEEEEEAFDDEIGTGKHRAGRPGQGKKGKDEGKKKGRKNMVVPVDVEEQKKVV